MADGDGQTGAGESASGKSKEISKQRKGILSRIWNGIFRRGGDDFEKRLQHLSKEEASVHARMKRRNQSWRRIARYIVIGSVILELAAVFYAIMKTRSLNLDWKERALTVLPIFVMPGLSAAIYSTYARFTRMREHKDQKTLESLRAERQAKIDELKERTNYYLTQQLIQRFDTDPAAKAAAATVLASKLGADSGLKVHIGDELKVDAPLGKSSDVELMQSNNRLRNRKQSHARHNSTESVLTQNFVEETPKIYGLDGQEAAAQDQSLVVEHRQSSAVKDGGWIARIAAMLVGEDPAQCYALICSNCHKHNGLARKEDFPYITYYCPHCHALNGSRQSEEQGSSSNPGNTSMPLLHNGESSSSAGSVSESEVVSGSKGAVSGSEGVNKGKESSEPAI